jgi:UDP:flavonoid glycosyltransferase YjiC (YdhE family)
MARRPEQARHVGFLQYDDDQNAADLAPLWGFVEQGSPPVVATFGSAMRHARWLLERFVQATEKLGTRLVILSKDPDQVPKPLPPHVFHAAWAPMGQLLPKGALLAHHGGIGTLARALGTGIPQLVIPFAHDQHDNAHRVRHLGLGDYLTPRWATFPRLTRVLGRLLGEAKYLDRAREYATRINPAVSLESACDLVEQMAG